MTNPADAAIKRSKRRSVRWVDNPCDVRTRCVACQEMIPEGEPMTVKITYEGDRSVLYQRFHDKPKCTKGRRR